MPNKDLSDRIQPRSEEGKTLIMQKLRNNLISRGKKKEEKQVRLPAGKEVPETRTGGKLFQTASANRERNGGERRGG